MVVTGLDVNGALDQHSPFWAQLQATLNVLPAHAFYALPNGAPTFLNARIADYLGLPKDHPQRFGTDTGADWDSNLAFLHPDDCEETRRVFEARSEAVIAAARTSAPGKPIRHIVLSHFHDDHSGGVRTYAAEGATVVLHSGADNYIRAVLDQRRMVEPDRLEIARRDGRQSEPAVMLVEDAITLTDGTRELKLYHVPNTHTSGMLVGYVPDARVLFTADLVTDTFPLNPPLASTVRELIKRIGSRSR
jgi:glyoxylase-like metal-dependent hydrolase (beta-lactamase superfamily II)